MLKPVIDRIKTHFLRMLHPALPYYLLGLVPLLVLTLFLAGETGPTGLAAGALVLVILLMLPLHDDRDKKDPLTGLAQRDGLLASPGHALDRPGAGQDRKAAAMLIEIDRFKLLEERHDRALIERILRITATRLAQALPSGSLAARLDGPTFAVALCALPPADRAGIERMPDLENTTSEGTGLARSDLEHVIQLAGRIQRALSEPIGIEGTNIYITTSIGFSLAVRIEQPTADSLVQAATSALIEAQRSGPSAVRSYSDALRGRIIARNSLSAEVGGALDRDEICAFFQPQISTRTGAITGFEALARWHHPRRGLIPPVEFLPALEQAGMMDRLCTIMVANALSAITQWDAAGFDIPRVGVNFSNEELSDPRLVDRIAFELDRHDLTPDRLVIEVLETVVANRSDDIVIRNLSGLARLGCCLDLDDFGTGHASITNIRRFSIERIKIDRSFVTRIDNDPEQQKMVGAILTMADRLGLDTLAEGVETAAEREMLATIGCGHVQGFGIARPMPMDETAAWIRAYAARDTRTVNMRRLVS